MSISASPSRVARHLLLAVAIVAVSAVLRAEERQPFLSWEAISELPSGVAGKGVFAWEDGGSLLLAGGRLSDGRLRDAIHVLTRDAAGGLTWHSGFRLPQPLADAGVVASPRGLLVAGGVGRDGPVREVFLLRWNAAGEAIDVTELPGLPEAIARPVAAMLGEEVWAAGFGRRTYRLRLGTEADAADSAEWLPGPLLPRAVDDSVHATVLTDGEHPRLYLLSVGQGGEVYRLSRDGERWEEMGAGSPPLLSRGQLSFGRAHLLAIARSDVVTGESRLVSYHSITGTWADRGSVPFGEAVEVLTQWGGDAVAVVSEAGSHRLYLGTPGPSKPWFGWLDYLALGVYFAGMVGMGIWFSGRNKGTGDYFLAGQRIPAWAAALSLMATSVSSIGFIAIPGKTFATDWLYFAGVATWFLVVPVVTNFFIPVLRRLNVTTAYEYLENRFDLSVRLCAALLFVLMQLGRIAIVLYLPALVLSSVIGINIYLCIVLMGGIAIVYTVMGGMEAVVWTDVVQVVILFGGALAAIVMALHGTGLGAAELWETAWEDGKFRMTDWRWDYTAAVVWVVLVGNIFTRFSNLTSDQALVQRYLSTPDARSAVRSLWGDVAVSIPWAIVAFGLGTALYLYYKSNPEKIVPGTEADAVVPLFIGQQMPPGVAGLIIAAVFAAAMSSLDSSIHSLSTVCVRDFQRRLCRTVTEAAQFAAARALTVFFGVIGTGGALVIAAYDVKSLWDLFMAIMGLFVGSLSGLFLLAMFVKRSHSRGALVGAVGSAIAVYLVSSLTTVHFYLYPAVGVASCVLFGYLASLLIPAGRRYHVEVLVR